jgi:hypothetical protein
VGHFEVLPLDWILQASTQNLVSQINQNKLKFFLFMRLLEKAIGGRMVQHLFHKLKVRL